MRTIHRISAFFLVLFIFYLAVTGSLIQMFDIKALLTHAPDSGQDMQAIFESEDGPNNFVVIAPSDYDAAALPGNFDFAASLSAAAPNQGAAPIKYVEWRMMNGQPVALFKTATQRLELNAVSGQVLAALPDRAGGGAANHSAHNAVKAYHRGNTVFGDWTLVVGLIIGIGLVTMIVTGLVVWGKLYAGRVRLGRYNPFWGAGGRWRQLHRSISLVSALFLLVIAFTGAWLEFDSLYRAVLLDVAASQMGAAHATERYNIDASSPLVDRELPGMLATTLASFQGAHPGTPIKVLRLRYYAGYPQGVVVSGGDETAQMVYNAHSGSSMSQTEPGYPQVYFPFGWQAHEILKKVHRGDYFGFSGRVMSLLSSFALIYLAISAIFMYLELLVKRRHIGKNELFWA